MVGGDQDEGVVVEAAGLQLLEEAADVAVHVEDLAVVQGHPFLEGDLAAAQVGPRGHEGPGEPLGRHVGAVGVVVVEEEEERLLFPALEPAQGAAGDLRRQAAGDRADGRVVVVVEALVEAEDLLHPGAAEDGAGGVPGLPQELRQGRLPRGQAARPEDLPRGGRVDGAVEAQGALGIVAGAVGGGELAGEQGRVGGQGPARRGGRLLVEDGLGRHPVEMGARVPGIAVAGEVVGAGRVEGDEDDVRAPAPAAAPAQQQGGGESGGEAAAEAALEDGAAAQAPGTVPPAHGRPTEACPTGPPVSMAPFVGVESKLTGLTRSMVAAPRPAAARAAWPISTGPVVNSGTL